MPRFRNEEDLDELLRKCRRGDATAWGSLVDRFQALTYSVIRRYGLSIEDADDVFQTTFQSLLRHVDRLESGAALPRWLAVTAAREAMRVKRISKRYVSEEDLPQTLDQVIAEEDASAEEAALLAERADVLRKNVLAMPAKCRDLLTMLYLQGEIAYAEVAERLGMAVGAIGPTRARCLEKLRLALQKTGVFD